MGLLNLNGAREELVKLKATVADLEAKNKELEAQVYLADKQISEQCEKTVRLEADLSTAKQSIATLTAAKDRAETDLKAAQETIAKTEPEVERRAAVKAAEITAKLGQPPVPTDPPKVDPDVSNLTGLAKAIALHKAENEAATATQR